MIWKSEVYDLSLLEKDFLISLIEQRNREIYARIISLDINELPLEQIEGKVTGGSINVDGNSAIRRTCSLTMITEDVDINNFYWGVKTKFKLEIGLRNNLIGKYAFVEEPPLDEGEIAYYPYPDIVWFEEGTFIISSFNTAISTNNCTISLSGKDKMCLLNGEFSGSLFASIDFGTEEYQESIMQPVNSYIASSKELTMRKYYYIPNLNQLRAQLELITTINNEERIRIFNNDSNYMFIRYRKENLEEGYDYFYKEKNYYLNCLPESIQFNDSTISKYICYKLVTDPSEAFKEFSVENNTNLKNNKSIYFKVNCGTNEKNTFKTNFKNTFQSQITTSTSLTKVKEVLTKNFDFLVSCYIGLKENEYDEIQIENFSTELLNSLKTGNQNFSSQVQAYFQQIQEEAKEEAKKAINYYENADDFTSLEGKKTYEMVGLYMLNYEYTIKKIPLYKIILESVHTYAKEPYHNIIVNDLKEYGLEQLTYKGDQTLLAFYNVEAGVYTNLAFIDSNDELKNLILDPSFHFKNLSEENTGNADDPTIVYLNMQTYHYTLTKPANNIPQKHFAIAQINYGDDIGYRLTDLTYTGDLISSIGESLTSILDKVKNMLGDFEYFYDVQGHFIFQKKKTFVNTSWSQLISNQEEEDSEIYADYMYSSREKFAFNFEGNRLITALNNSPNIANLKNDFTVWGKRKGVSGADIPIHARYAIDKKPLEYLSLKGILYYTEEAIKNPSPYNKDRIQDSTDYQLTIFEKDTAIIPNYLYNQNGTCDWWELKNWAEYYKIITGAYPSQTLQNYSTEPFIGSISFPNGHIQTCTSQLIIDLYTNEDISQPDNFIPYTLKGWNPFQHGTNNCHHTYAWYLSSFGETHPNSVSFIYKPEIPKNYMDDIEGNSSQLNTIEDKLVDWRELIYQMALDYFSGQGCSEKSPIYDLQGHMVINDPEQFLFEVGKRNPYYYPTGTTGYEQYYTDMEGFWRQLYNPEYIPSEIYSEGYYEEKIYQKDGSPFFKKYSSWENGEITDLEIEYFVSRANPDILQQYLKVFPLKFFKDKFYDKYYLEANDISKRYWNVNVFEAPETLNFWIEFLDSDSELAQFSIPAIGDRSKTIHDDKVKSIFYKEIPGFILYENTALEEEVDENNNSQPFLSLKNKIGTNSGYQFIYLPQGFSQYFTLSYRGISAKDKIDNLIYQFAYCIESISITSIPIYHLEPNTRIYVYDESTGINGEYIVNKITIPLAYNGTMSISAVKAQERLY